MDQETSERLYKIQSYPDDFRAGILQDGTQVLIGLGVRDLIAPIFDPSGNYLTTLIRKLSSSTDAASFWHQMEEQLDQWKIELSFTEDMIAIKKFSLPELEVEIQDIPEYLQEILGSGTVPDEDQREEIDTWQREGHFVLIWGRDLWLDKEGEVWST